MGETHPIRKGRRVFVERLIFSNVLNVCVKGEERVRKDLQRMTHDKTKSCAECLDKCVFIAENNIKTKR